MTASEWLRSQRHPPPRLTTMPSLITAKRMLRQHCSHKRWRFLRLLLCFGLTLLLCIGQWPNRLLAMESKASTAVGISQEAIESAAPAEQVRRGVTRYQAGDFQGAVQPWKLALERYQILGDAPNSVIVLENLARTMQQLGQNAKAVDYWERAIAFHQQLNQPQKLGRALTEQAQAYSRLGQHRRALALLCNALPGENLAESETGRLNPADCAAGTALALAEQQADPLGQVAALGSIGAAYRLIGEPEEAIRVLEQAQQLTQTLDNPAIEVSLSQSLGNLRVGQANADYRTAEATERIGEGFRAKPIRERAKENDQLALAAFEQGLAIASELRDPSPTLQLALNSVPVHRRLEQVTLAQERWTEARQQLEQLPDSQEKAFAAIALATLANPNQTRLAISLSRNICPASAVQPVARQLLSQGLEIARSIRDQRAESFALGQLGYLEECDQNWGAALQRVEEARWIAEQDRSAQDSLYLWDWLRGRILLELGQEEVAAIAYEEAIKNLEAIRSDILTANQDLQFDFRDTVEPIYRQLAALNLDKIPPSEVLSKSNERFKTIDTTLETVDSLKLSELQNYFGSDCVIAPVAQSVREVQTANADTAIVNTLTFPERTAVIYSFPDGATQMEWLELSQAELREKTIRFRSNLEAFTKNEPGSTTYEPEFDSKIQGKELYDSLVKPFEAQLAANQISTLVFVNDGILRSVPMAALYDGEQFLIQRYAVATTPSLQLTDPQPLQRDSLRVLALGVTESSRVDGERFSALPFVADEVEALSQRLPTTKLLNDAFSEESLAQKFTSTRYPIVHLATHGKFGADPQENFLVTGGDEKITIGDLDRLIRKVAPTTEPIELLMLTACETAIGDDRAALGLAGVAIRAGARSAVASLWSISDEFTAQAMDSFYARLADPTVSKAKALQAAQVALIEQGGAAAHPARWAPYLLIGNWL